VTTISQAREAINQRWIDGWGNRTPYTFSNESYKPDTRAWARVTARHEFGRQDTLGGEGNRKFLYGGRLFLQLFTLRDRGTKEIDDHAQFAKDIFEGRKFDGVWVTRAVPRELGEDGPWHMLTVECEFTYEQVK